MKYVMVALFMVCSLGLRAQELAILKLGAPIPMAEEKVKSVGGKEYSIKDAMMKNGVLVMFSCNTCPYVVKYQNRTVEVINAARQKGIGVIILNSNEAQRSDEDSHAAMKAYAAAHGYGDFPYVIDKNSALANAFGASRTPECFLFDAAGKLVYHGAIDDNPTAAEVKRNHLTFAINEMSSGKPVTVTESRSVGCTIKRL